MLMPRAGASARVQEKVVVRAGRGHEHTLSYVFMSTLCVFMSPYVLAFARVGDRAHSTLCVHVNPLCVHVTLGPGLRAGRGREHTLPYVFIFTLCVLMSP